MFEIMLRTVFLGAAHFVFIINIRPAVHYNPRPFALWSSRTRDFHFHQGYEAHFGAISTLDMLW